jgi:hypothetical protein
MLPGVRVVEVRLRDKPQRDDKQGGEERKILDHGQAGSNPKVRFADNTPRNAQEGSIHKL